MAHGPATCPSCNRFAPQERGWIEHAEGAAALEIFEVTLRAIRGIVTAALESLF
jgi:hypothetical protein